MWENRKRTTKFWIKAVIFIPLAIAAGIIIFGGIVMLLWNALIPNIFGLSAITFWQALGILVLARILFGGFGKSHHSKSKSRFDHRTWMKLSPEEREEMKKRWRERCNPVKTAEE